MRVFARLSVLRSCILWESEISKESGTVIKSEMVNVKHMYPCLFCNRHGYKETNLELFLRSGEVGYFTVFDYIRSL